MLFNGGACRIRWIRRLQHGYLRCTRAAITSCPISDGLPHRDRETLILHHSLPAGEWPIWICYAMKFDDGDRLHWLTWMSRRKLVASRYGCDRRNTIRKL